MDHLLFSLNIVMPMAILMAIGNLFRRIGFFSADFIRTGKKLCFYVLLSCSLFKNLYDSYFDVVPYRFILFVVLSIFFEIVISAAIAHRIADRREEIGVIIQGSFRSNFAFIGIPLASMFFSDAALLSKLSSEISLVSVIVIPLFNVAAVISLMKYSDRKDDTDLLKKTVLGIAKNPCIISIVCGLCVLVFRSIIPASAYFMQERLPFIYKSLSYLASMSTPFAFLLVGADLDLSKSFSNMKKLLTVVALRDFIFPALILAAAMLLKAADNAEYAILVSVFASPTAVSSAIMASEMGGDSELASGIVMYTTLFSLISLLIIITILKGVGCL